MTTANEIIERLPRVIWFGLIMAFGILLLAARLWWLQVVQYSKYGESGERQSLRTIRTPAARGRIYDRNGVCLVDNRPLYDLILHLEEVRSGSGPRGARKGMKTTVRLVRDRLEMVSAQIRYPIVIDTNSIISHMTNSMPLPFTVLKNLPEDAVARFIARSDHIPAVDLQVGVQRVYPYGSLAAHLLGYVGRTSFPPGERFGQFYYYMPDMMGKEGIEAQFDDQLRGSAGGKSLLVDVAGYRHAEIGMRLPEPGRNIHLTIDARIQKIVEEAMGDQVGAAVVVDPMNGDILAMCSVPSYDPNAFVPRISEELFNRMLTDPDKPFLNRAISAYEPGSTFKIVTSLAGLEKGIITPSTTSVCEGSIQIGNQTYRCWIHSKGGVHGTVDFVHAIKYSCNIFFYEHGIEVGGTNLLAMAKQFKFGERTGVPLSAYEFDNSVGNYQLREVEKKGRLPSETKLRMKGEVANMSIGQGDVQATPLQMAYFAAALANGGKIWAPRLVDYFESQDSSLPREQRIEPLAPQLRGRVEVSSRNLNVVRDAMLHVVADDDATGHKAQVAGVRIAGKSGTAQFPQPDPITGEMKLTGHHVWFISFAPFDEPRYAMAIMVEEGDSGGTTAAPIAGQIYRKLFAQPEIRDSLTRNSVADTAEILSRITNHESRITSSHAN